ncbi:MAG: hypothetical protein ACOWWR_17450 [Eubacteriales bacterium]
MRQVKILLCTIMQRDIPLSLLLFILGFSHSVLSCKAQEETMFTPLSREIIERYLSEKNVLNLLKPQKHAIVLDFVKCENNQENILIKIYDYDLETSFDAFFFMGTYEGYSVFYNDPIFKMFFDNRNKINRYQRNDENFVLIENGDTIGVVPPESNVITDYDPLLILMFTVVGDNIVQEEL